MKRNKTTTKRLLHFVGTRKYRDKIIADTNHDLGIDYKREGKIEQAIIAYSKAIKLNPRDDSSFYNRGSIFQNLGEIEKALADFNQAISINPNHSGAYNNRGLIFSKINDENGALENYSKAIEKGIETNCEFVFYSYTNRSGVHRRMGNLEQSIADCNEAIKICPSHAPAYVIRANAYHERGEYEKAIEDYSTAIELKPKYVIAYKNRIGTFRKLGQNELATLDEKKIKELESAENQIRIS